MFGSEEKIPLVSIARILRTHGVRGKVEAEVLTDFPERFAKIDRVFLEDPAGKRQAVILEAFAVHKDRVILKFQDIDSLDRARSLVAWEVRIPEGEIMQLPPDTYYDYQLVGCEVLDLKGHPLGQVREILKAGESSLLVVRGTGRELLIPAVAAICRQVDVEARRIVVEPPAGLLEL
ncbi:MAG: 16S rRNA processing protein RimM [Acidobacteria bacterium]|nr:16S rRNA processing protein RimM [Acidobacteriota bacterium]